MHTNKGISSLAFKGLMHIKINITAMRPNFLLHMLWTFMSKNKHIFGNNISKRDKIMVNPPEVHFSITRP
jgi:hypothetical protein